MSQGPSPAEQKIIHLFSKKIIDKEPHTSIDRLLTRSEILNKVGLLFTEKQVKRASDETARYSISANTCLNTVSFWQIFFNVTVLIFIFIWLYFLSKEYQKNTAISILILATPSIVVFILDKILFPILVESIVGKTMYKIACRYNEPYEILRKEKIFDLIFSMKPQFVDNEMLTACVVHRMKEICKVILNRERDGRSTKRYKIRLNHLMGLRTSLALDNIPEMEDIFLLAKKELT